MECVVFYQRPSLRDPYLVLGFSGWPDAGAVSSRTLNYLIEKLDAVKFAQLEAEEFYYFPSLRPLIAVEGGEIRGYSFPSNDIFFWQSDLAPHDLILFRGIEPHLRWWKFVNCILDLAEEFNVRRLFTIGGTYDQIPHTREPKVSALTSHPQLLKELKLYNVNFTTYYGPSSIHSALLLACRQRGIEGISLWGHAPYYIQQPNPRVCHSILLRLLPMLGIDIELNDLMVEAASLDAQVNKALSENQELLAYLKKLEEWYARQEAQEEVPSSTDFPEAPGEQEKLIKEIEEFLRRHREQG